MMASEATLLQAAINTGIAAFGKDGGRKAGAQFSKLIKSLLADESSSPEVPLPPTPAEARLRAKKARAPRNT